MLGAALAGSAAAGFLAVPGRERLLAEAGTLSERGYFELAADRLERWRFLHGGRPEYASVLSLMQIRSGQARAALPAIQAFLLREPGDGNARLALAESYRQLGDCARALPEFDQAIERASSSETARLGKANCLLSLQKGPEAMEFLRLSTQLVPESVALWEQLGTVYQKFSMRAELKDVFRRLAELAPENYGYRKNYLKLLRELNLGAELRLAAEDAKRRFPASVRELDALARPPDPPKGMEHLGAPPGTRR